jgi:hypothetical protein
MGLTFNVLDFSINFDFFCRELFFEFFSIFKKKKFIGFWQLQKKNGYFDWRDELYEFDVSSSNNRRIILGTDTVF